MNDANQPDISVVVIVYNDAPHLAAAVRSVLTQSVASLEVIICDDHSTDETPEVARRLAAEDARITYHRRAENAGAPGTPLNDGLEIALGKYVMFLGSDDALVPGACAALLSRAEESGADMVSGQLVRVLLAEGARRVPWFPEFHESERSVEGLEEAPELLRDTLTTNKLYRRNFLERIDARFPERMLYEDVVFSAETLAQAQGIVLIPDEVYEWNVYPRDERESITNQRHTKRNLTDRLRALDLAEQAFAPLGEAVHREFESKVLTHHLRFYLNDLRESDNDWARWVLDTIRPRLEHTSLAAFRRGFLGDRALYAAALDGDVDAVREVLRGKAGGALAGHVYQDGDETFWAPRDRESRPKSSQLARDVSDFSDRSGALKPHRDFDYLFALTNIAMHDDRVELLGSATDPLGVLANDQTALELRLAPDSRSVENLATVRVEATPEGVRWSAALALPKQVSPRDGELRRLTMRSVAADGAANVSPVQSELGADESELSDTRHPEQTWRVVGEPRSALRFEFTGFVEPAPKRVVVIGDVSWQRRYHLGDEAMTESAILQLRERGFDITLIAGDPELSSEFYDVDAVPVFGFAKCRSDEALGARLNEIQEVAGGRAAAGSPDDERTIAAVGSADAVVIAGGGNMNSSGVHHVYERLALKRIAEAAGVPLYVSSQTVGPHLLAKHRPLVREIAEYATVFGARERATAALMRELCGDAATIVQTLDDAILLDPAETRAKPKPVESASGHYVIGSFTYHAFSTGLSREEYYRDLARMLDDVVSTHDVDVLLCPHMGVLGPSEQSGQDNDQFGHDRIVAYTTSGRVRSLPLISARELFALTRDARFTISTRYHPVVFAAALGVPAIGVVTSYYSALRMRGALAHVGMESFAIPYEHWSLFGPRVLDALAADHDRFADALRDAGAQQRRFQSRWWSGIADHIAGGGAIDHRDVISVDGAEWTDARNDELLAVARVAQEGTNMYRMNNLFTVERHRAQITELQREAREARELTEQLRREIADMRHRMRPPGAAVRDRLRGSLRRLRER